MRLGRSSDSGELNGFLDAGSSIRGDLHFEDNFRVDGRLIGRIVSKGDLVVGEDGEVDGEVEVKNLYVRGSKIYADIEAQTFHIDDGAQFEGHCKMRGKGGPEPSVGEIAVARRAEGVLPRRNSRE